MSLSDTLRKAAGLFVEIPEPEAPVIRAGVRPTIVPDQPAATPPTTSPSGAAAPEEDDLDRRLAEMDRTIGRMGTVTETPATASKTVGQIVRDSHGPNLEEIYVPAGQAAGAMRPDGTLDYSALYAAAGLPSTPFTAEQTIEMLTSLPQSLPLEMKRQTVQVTLASIGKSIGATPETIVADTSRKLAALTAYSEGFARHTGDYVAKTEAEIAELQAQMEQKRTEMLAARQQQSDIQRLCGAEAARLDDVLEFFSLDVPPSRHAEDGLSGSAG